MESVCEGGEGWTSMCDLIWIIAEWKECEGGEGWTSMCDLIWIIAEWKESVKEGRGGPACVI